MFQPPEVTIAFVIVLLLAGLLVAMFFLLRRRQPATDQTREEGPMDVRVDFGAIPWQSTAPGQRHKVAARGAQRLRLVEFTEAFEEDGWCTAGHTGHVLEGGLTLELRDPDAPGGAVATRLAAGDDFLIPAGDACAHRAVLEAGERALLLLAEVAQPGDPDAGG